MYLENSTFRFLLQQSHAIDSTSETLLFVMNVDKMYLENSTFRFLLQQSHAIDSTSVSTMTWECCSKHVEHVYGIRLLQ
jgi:hypothetical protein